MTAIDHTESNWRVLRHLYGGSDPWAECVDGRLMNVRLPDRHFRALVLAARTKPFGTRRPRNMDNNFRFAVGNWLWSKEFGAWRNPNKRHPYQGNNQELWAEFLAATVELKLKETLELEATAGKTPAPVIDAADEDEADEYFPSGTDRRAVTVQQIRKRRGQKAFRDALRKRYGERCLITGCQLLAVLEAAHISPYRGEDDNHPANGLLLRSDIHTLFDLDLLGVEPTTLRVQLHPDAVGEYGQYAGKVLECKPDRRPELSALELRQAQFQLRLGNAAG